MKSTHALSHILATVLFLSLAGCAGSSSGDSNQELNETLDPYADLLSYGLGHYTGDCTSASTGMAVPGGAIDLMENGFLQGQEFTTTIAKETHLISLTQTRTADKASIMKADWEAGPNPMSMVRTGLQLRYDSSNDPALNRAYSRKEENSSLLGIDCRGAVTNRLVRSDAFDTFSKYLKSPKAVFTLCMCGDSGNNQSVPVSDFHCDRTSISMGSEKMDLTQKFVQQSAVVNASSTTQSFIYSLKPTDNSYTTLTFDKDLQLTNFSIQFESGKTCSCIKP